MYQCPKGHTSTDSDYCSECGAPISATSVSKTVVTSPSSNESICPDCGTSRVSGSRFCEVCRYDFQNKTPNAVELPPPSVEIPVQTVTSPEEKVVAPIESSVAGYTHHETGRLNVIVAVDLSRLTAEEKQNYTCPTDEREKIFPLDLDENLVGRRSGDRKIYPEIEINDSGISRRHLKFIKQEDDSFSVLELGSANGTILNGAELESGVLTPVKVGDQFLIGMWTRLILR